MERYGLDKGIRNKTVEVLASKAADSLPKRLLCLEVRKALKTRQDWLGQPICNE
ncbi:hypothetical protein GL4_1526 [Methyloceanibacter caenitepidi]|uniref:Uncharacterized protein n=1 Tax=Methyloceanibacter caenitepidi TaxID=1384459 RepID=A0A0A8K368_9HYPH|nr:hypothetical protein GL4_1526 [Methyloceanibacter caenitepidi]